MATTNTTTATTKKVTKAQRNSDIILLLQGKEVPDKRTTVEDAIAHLTHENELLARKNKPGKGKKLTKDQEKNEGYKDDIRAYLSANPSMLVSANDIMVKLFMPKYPDVLWSNQKVASLLNAMSDKYDKDGNCTDDTGELSKTPGKGKNKTTYQIKPEYILSGEDDAEDEDAAEA